MPSLSGPPAQEHQWNADTFLEEHDPYIVTQAKKNVASIRRLLHPGAVEMEIDDLAQKIRVKLWMAASKKRIENPKAYIKRIAHNELISMLRQNKQTVPLTPNEEGEFHQANGLFTCGEGMQDPQEEIEQKETITYYIHQMVEIVAALPGTQQKAMLCSLKDRADDILAWIEAFLPFGIDIESACWPDASDKQQSLRASVSVARKKMRAKMGWFTICD